MSTITYHNHHIIPKHAGGTDAPDNLVRLTVPEHTEAHRLLYEKYGRWQDKLAWEMLAGFKGREEIIKEIQSRPKSEITKKKMSESKKGHIVTEETRKKISESKKGKYNGQYGENHPMYGRTGEKNPFYGKTHSVEVIKKLSEFAKNRVFTEEHKKKISEASKIRKRNSKGHFTK